MRAPPLGPVRPALRRLLALLSLPLALALALPAGARDLTEMDGFSASAIDLRMPRELARSKTRSSRERWSWGVVATSMMGFDSNPVQAPDATGSGLSTVGLRGELRRYVTDNDSLKFTATGRFIPYWRDTSTLSEISQDLTARYTHHYDFGRRFSFFTAFRHENDHATTIDGVNLERNFEYFSYRMQPSVTWRVGPGHGFRLRYGARHKDYVETPGSESLDWWKHGPSFRYELGLGEIGRAGLEYRFAVQHYLEESAALEDGSEPAGAPAEEHLFHAVGIDTSFQVLRWLVVATGYRFRMKDDLYRGFESYESHSARLGFAVNPTETLSLDLRTSYEFRDFEEREADSPGSTLNYNRFRTRFAARQSLNEHMSVLAQYDLGVRDSNRSTGGSFRSYDRHRVLAGMSFAY
ncbi:MAG: hypothetical protein QNK04_20035 [Myxococcota bacterium]|nr:hypothetical protein [Myxococcota bacterium]